MKLDIYTHVFPQTFFDKMEEVVEDKGPIKRWLNIPVLYDIDARLRMMDDFGEYQQVLTLSAPAIEFVAGPAQSPEMARIANDGMAAICKAHPDRFPCFIASVPMNNPEATVVEIDRAINELDARGIQIFSNVNGKPLDLPEFEPVFDKMAGYDLPIWLHPTRGPNFPDYRTEEKSKFEVWFVFGWPYETSVAMSRLVFAGIFDRYPDIKIITHHMGAMIPYFEGRVGPGWDQLGTRTSDEDYGALLEKLKKRPLDYFKMFYADTALFGATAGTVCGLDFFGVDKVVFASDCPFDPEGGPMYIRDTIDIMDKLNVSEADREKLFNSNARSLMKLD